MVLQTKDCYMQIDSLHIHEQEFDLFVNLKPKQKIEFLYDLQSKGMDAALSKVVIPPLQEEFEVEFEADFEIEDQQDKDQPINELFQDTQYEQFLWGDHKLNLLVINRSIHINSTSLKWLRRMILKLWMDGHILIRNKFAKKIPGIDKYRYYRCYDIIGTVPPICLS